MNLMRFVFILIKFLCIDMTVLSTRTTVVLDEDTEQDSNWFRLHYLVIISAEWNDDHDNFTHGCYQRQQCITNFVMFSIWYSAWLTFRFLCGRAVAAIDSWLELMWWLIKLIILNYIWRDAVSCQRSQTATWQRTSSNQKDHVNQWNAPRETNRIGTLLKAPLLYSRSISPNLSRTRGVNAWTEWTLARNDCTIMTVGLLLINVVIGILLLLTNMSRTIMHDLCPSSNPTWNMSNYNGHFASDKQEMYKMVFILVFDVCNNTHMPLTLCWTAAFIVLLL